ncbi:MAG: class III extradiol dioxygenase subunit beta [Rhodospirillaceae bacterium]
MAKIIAGIGATHTPAIGVAMDKGTTDTNYWKPLFAGYPAAREWMAEAKPDVGIVCYNDHASALSLEMIPTFVIGVAPEFQPADEGYGARPIPVFEGHPELAWHMVESLVMDEFDITIANELPVDHGLSVPLSITCGQPDKWPFKVIPLAINVIQYPQPTGRRCYNLGKAIRRAVDSFDDDLKVVIFGTGGMSHQLQGERAGLINSDFDRAFLDDLTGDVDRLTKIPHTEYLREAGSEGIELIMWLIMRGALDADAKEVYRHYHVPASNSGAGLIVLENA